MHSTILEELRPRPLYYTTHRRQEAMGEPVGDALGGPAFGQKRGPAIAVFGAFASVSAGLAAGGLMGGLMIAGGVMSGLGAITGNKTLSSLGMIAGLAGGVGNFFQKGGFDSFSQAYQADGISGVADQFTGAVDYGYNPGQVMDGAMGQVAPSAAQSILPKVDTQSILSGSAGSPFGGAPAPNVSQLGVEFPAGTVAPGVEVGANLNGGLLSNPVGANLGGAAPAAGGGVVDTLTGLWKGSGDFTKMALINAGSGALKGMAESETNDKLLSLKESQTEAGNRLTDAQTAALEKKNDGIKTVSIGNFGSNRSAAFGTGADGNYRTYAEYIQDRTAAMQRLFGQPQTA